MAVSEQELTSLAATHDIISLGMLADDLRRQRHALNTTFVRVADVAVDTGGPMAIPAGAGEVRIVGAPATRAAAVDRVRQVMAQAQGRVVSAFSLADLEVAGRARRRHASSAARRAARRRSGAGRGGPVRSPAGSAAVGGGSEYFRAGARAPDRASIAVARSSAAVEGGRRSPAQRSRSSARSLRSRAARTPPRRAPATTM